jgi:hypothetical protein
MKSVRIAAHFALLVSTLLTISACTPQYDWREVRGSAAPYVAVFPAKPAALSRAVNLDGLPITMTLTAAEINGVSFAVGSAPLTDPSKASAALQAMKLALIRNIGGIAKAEKQMPMAGIPIPAIEVEALGKASANTKGQPRLLVARFVSKDKHIYQVLVTGPEKEVSREALDIFFSSFKLD